MGRGARFSRRWRFGFLWAGRGRLRGAIGMCRCCWGRGVILRIGGAEVGELRQGLVAFGGLGDGVWRGVDVVNNR